MRVVKCKPHGYEMRVPSVRLGVFYALDWRELPRRPTTTSGGSSLAHEAHQVIALRTCLPTSNQTLAKRLLAGSSIGFELHSSRYTSRSPIVQSI
jgi:hypothetical protein